MKTDTQPTEMTDLNPSEGLIFPDFHAFVGPPTRTMKRLAKLFALKEHPLAATRSAPSLCTSDDMDELLYDRVVRNPIRVWAARSVDEAVQTNQEIKRSKREMSFNFFNYPEHVERCSLILYASRTDNAVEGVLACDRSIFVDEDGEIGYCLDMELIYVTPKARRKSVATALKMCLIEIMRDDLDHLVTIGRRNRRKVPISVWMHGDIESEGGERAINEVYALVEMYAETIWEDYPIDFTADWGW